MLYLILCNTSFVFYCVLTSTSVMLVLRGLQNSNFLVVLGGLALCLLFMIQIKQIYNNNQKYNRYLNYKQYINEIATELRTVINSVNKSSAYVHQLNEMLTKYREKESKNISTSRVIPPS